MEDQQQCPAGQHWDAKRMKCVKGEPKKAPYGIDKEASDEVDTEDSVQVEEGLRSKASELLFGKKEDRIERLKKQRREKAAALRKSSPKKEEPKKAESKPAEKDPWSHPDDVKYHKKEDNYKKEDYSMYMDENLAALYQKYNDKEAQKPGGPDSKGKTYDKFKSDAKKAKSERYKKDSEEARATFRTKGVRFSDAKGTGYIRDGKKHYD